MNKLFFLNTKDANALYRVKHHVSDPFFFLETDEMGYAFIDQREFAIFSKDLPHKTQAVRLEPFIEKASAINEPVSLAIRISLKILEEYSIQNISVPSNFPLDMADYLRSKGIIITVAEPFYKERLYKSEYEVGAMESAISRTTKAYELIEKILKESTIQSDNTLLYKNEILTSERMKKEVDMLLLQEGLLSTEGMIIASKEQAAIPHHAGSGTLYAHSTIICDLFPRDTSNGYFADMTRTYIKGTPTQYMLDMYATVQEAQKKALEAIKPGVKCRDIHQICIDVFLNRGFHVGDKGFIHGTGHGLGLDIHEAPRMNAVTTETLEVGHVVTVEPGLYYNEHGGIRIEDVVVVTENGARNLTNYPKQFIIE